MKREKWRRSRRLFKAKFHYTDPHGPNGVSPQKKSVRVRAGPVGSVSGPCRVRVVEFSYYATKSQSLQLDFVARSSPALVRQDRAIKSQV